MFGGNKPGDVVEAVTAISALAKLIGLGIKGWSAIEARGFDEKDLAAIQGLLETTASLSSLHARATPAAAAQHLALVARSFGQAVGRHQEFHGKLQLTGGLRRWLHRDDRQRAEEIELRVKVAALRLRELGNDPRGEVDFVRALMSPLDTPYYRQLWQAFSGPDLTLTGEEPPLVMSLTARREFERYFLLAYLAAIESPAGRGVAAYLDGLQRYRQILVRDLLLEDMASWGGRHIFGNLPRESWTNHEGVPFLPLDALYVETRGAVERPGEVGDTEPLLELIERLATGDDTRTVILVVADFGSGKSLSARMLARRWAETALEASSVSLDAVLPIYVRCAEDFPHEAVDLNATVRSAWKRQADGFGLSIADDDDALAWPSDAQRTVCLLDGLDEVALGDQHLKTLFQKLQRRTTTRQRFVVFSRPGAVPARGDLGDGVTVVRVLPFGADQIERWLAAWNQLRGDAPVVTLGAIEALGLGELVQTPILLFMIAFTWERYSAHTQAPSRAAIYEGFFGQIAAGKARADKERHGPIAAAAEAILAALRNRGVLDQTAQSSDAMLWLMGRVAWQAQMLEQQLPPEALTRRHVDNLLHDELRLSGDAAHAIKVGLILALQSDLQSANHPILFGHQSFREFLVGRHWATQLHQLVRGNPREWERRTRALLGGRLLAEDRGLDFLMQIVNGDADPQRATPSTAWTDHDRETLVHWAQEVFSDDSQLFRERGSHDGGTRLHDDQRAVLREAALAIGSLTLGSTGLRGDDPQTLRSMLAWFWAQQLRARVIAPQANLPGAALAGARMWMADLTYAVLDGADLSDAILVFSHLDHARLVGALLGGAKLSRVWAEGALLTGARLNSATLTDVVLDGARLDDAVLIFAHLHICTLVEASLVRADLTNTELFDVILRRADLSAAKLIGARLTSADLAGAKLVDAVLEYANLTEADLRGADLRGAALTGARFDRARYDDKTRWPDGFDPDAHGAERIV